MMQVNSELFLQKLKDGWNNINLQSNTTNFLEIFLTGYIDIELLSRKKTFVFPEENY